MEADGNRQVMDRLSMGAYEIDLINPHARFLRNAEGSFGKELAEEEVAPRDRINARRVGIGLREEKFFQAGRIRLREKCNLAEFCVRAVAARFYQCRVDPVGGGARDEADDRLFFQMDDRVQFCFGDQGI